MPSIQERVGREVRRLRQTKCWTQEQLGHRAGRHWTYIGGIERGERNITIRVLADLAEALGVSIEDLFRGRKRS